MWDSSITSTIYKIIMISYQKINTFSNSKENETKGTKEVSKQNIYTFLKLYTFLLLLSNIYFNLVLTSQFRLPFLFCISFFVFSQHVHTKMLHSHSYSLCHPMVILPRLKIIYFRHINVPIAWIPKRKLLQEIPMRKLSSLLRMVISSVDQGSLYMIFTFVIYLLLRII